jgi:Carboxypeptidase regulatory-like domain
VIYPKGFSFSGTLALSSYLPTVLLLASFPLDVAHAQKQPKPGQPYALIFGTVWGPNDRPVYGVRVKIRRAQDKKAKWELLSDHQGEFAQRLPAGKADYVVWADLKDFKAADGTTLHSGQDVTVHVASDERVDIGLHLTK